MGEGYVGDVTMAEFLGDSSATDMEEFCEATRCHIDWINEASLSRGKMSTAA